MRVLICLLLLLSLSLCKKYGEFQLHKFNDKDSDDQLALQTAKDHLKLQSNTSGLKFKEVYTSFKQIVGGVKYVLVLSFETDKKIPLLYEVELFLKPWEHYAEIQGFSLVDQQSSDLAVNHFLREQILSAALKYILSKSDGKLTGYEVTVYEVISTQIVSGVIYELKVTIANDKGQQHKYLLKAQSQPWILEQPVLIIKIEEIKVEQKNQEQNGNDESKKSGGYQAYEWDYEGENEKLAKKTLKEYFSQFVKGEFLLLSVDLAESQVVAGIKFRIVFSYQVNKGSNRRAEAHIWLQPWKNFGEVNYFTVLS